jgi:CRISPR/Cas system-associated protein Cas5 (RAMP superfamily)
MINKEQMEKEVLILNSVEISILSFEEKKNYFSKLDLEKYRKSKINSFNDFYSFFDSISSTYSVLNDNIDNQIIDFNCYESNTHYVSNLLIVYSNFIIKNKDVILSTYQNYFNDKDESEKDIYRKLYFDFNDKIKLLDTEKDKLIKKLEENICKSSFVSESQRKLFSSWNNSIFVKYLFKNKIHLMLTKEEDANLNIKDISKSLNSFISIIDSDSFLAIPQLKEREDYILFKSHSKNIITSFDKIINKSFKNHFPEKTFNKKELKIVKKFKSKYLP